MFSLSHAPCPSSHTRQAGGSGAGRAVQVGDLLTITYPNTGHVLATEGEQGDSMFFIIHGNIEIVDESSGAPQHDCA
jgi:CRP-like cAMP-binding protein